MTTRSTAARAMGLAMCLVIFPALVSSFSGVPAIGCTSVSAGRHRGAAVRRLRAAGARASSPRAVATLASDPREPCSDAPALWGNVGDGLVAEPGTNAPVACSAPTAITIVDPIVGGTSLARSSTIFYLQMAQHELQQHNLRVEHNMALSAQQQAAVQERHRAPVVLPMISDIGAALFRHVDNFFRMVAAALAVVWSALFGSSRKHAAVPVPVPVAVYTGREQRM
eukprot:CAMPEP_0173403840 /NCGR_PEP_ID=MMETSP1356-20130122/57758_1 /TAXON_ID=77927 ORGANISM="Hemiselmis virescens, Strain PCC157" /NCGR_SAMPLE_ID=MMETSP1356 /ASSEMBLY_ACC=CAM_ASM_000847 /LENGTH=224 /DNA_ID=CAMNT_0014364417 /DNA_START=104 /DNA_END=778 /DNA_ORIENTATION=-